MPPVRRIPQRGRPGYTDPRTGAMYDPQGYLIPGSDRPTPSAAPAPRRAPARAPAGAPATAPAAAPTGPVDPITQQAAADADVRYGPEEFMLESLAVEALRELQGDIATQGTIAESLQAAAQQAQPRMQAAYQSAISAIEGLEDFDIDVGGDIGERFEAAGERESAAAQGRLQEGLAGAMGELVHRQVGAEQGRAFGTQRALSEYDEDLRKINEQRMRIAGERGSFAVSQAGKIREARTQAAMEAERIANTERHNQVMEALGFGNLGVAQAGLGLEQQRIDIARNEAAQEGGLPKPTESDRKFSANFQKLVNDIAYARSIGWSPAKIRANKSRPAVVGGKPIAPPPKWAVDAAFQVVNSGAGGQGAISPNTYGYIRRNQRLSIPQAGWQVPSYRSQARTVGGVRGRT